MFSRMFFFGFGDDNCPQSNFPSSRMSRATPLSVPSVAANCIMLQETQMSHPEIRAMPLRASSGHAVYYRYTILAMSIAQHRPVIKTSSFKKPRLVFQNSRNFA